MKTPRTHTEALALLLPTSRAKELTGIHSQTNTRIAPAHLLAYTVLGLVSGTELTEAGYDLLLRVGPPLSAFRGLPLLLDRPASGIALASIILRQYLSDLAAIARAERTFLDGYGFVSLDTAGKISVSLSLAYYEAFKVLGLVKAQKLTDFGECVAFPERAAARQEGGFRA